MTRTLAVLGTRPTHGDSLGVWLGLVVAAVLLAVGGGPPRGQVLALIVVVVTLLVSLRLRLGPVALLVLLAVGVHLRLTYLGVGTSDVLAVTRSAIDEVLAGGNPYGRGFDSTIPPGAPYAYGPVALLWYLPWPDLGRFELAVSLATLALLALRGHALGLAIFATMPILAGLASDGSNDSSGGLLLLAALVVAARSPLAGGLLLGVAAGFKPYAFAWAAPMVALGGLGALAGIAVTTLATWGVAIVVWGLPAILTSFAMSEAVHRSAYYSLSYALGLSESTGRLFDRLRFIVGGALALGSWLLVRSHASMVIWGAAVFLVVLFAGFWSTFAYLAALAPVICWYLEPWLGLSHARVAWPGDPVGRITAWADRRWPAPTMSA